MEVIRLDWQVLCDAAVERPTPESLAKLISALQDSATGETPRQAIAEVLGKLAVGHAEALEALITFAKDEDTTLRGLAAIGLGLVPVQTAVECLIGLLADTTNTVRNLAERSLLQMNASVQQFGMDRLLALLSHPVPLTRSPAARLLGLTRDLRGFQPLLSLVANDKQWLVRMWAAKGLGDLGNDAAFDALADRLRNDEKNRVRAAAAESLGKLCHPGIEAALTLALNDEDGGVQKHAEESLSKLRRSRLGHDEPEEHHEPHFAEGSTAPEERASGH